MKHLIIFLDYCQSRIQHPVYRQFAATPLTRRSASLLFLPKPPEERELLHEVADLNRRGSTQDEVIIHLCANLERHNAGPQLTDSMMLVQRVMPGCTTLAYVYLPDVRQKTDAQRNIIWNNLVMLNNCVAEHPDTPLVQHIYTYNDSTHNTLATFLYNTTQQTAIWQTTGNTRPEGAMPTLFAGLGASSISYPDKEVRHYLQLTYLLGVMRMSRLEHNPVTMATCNDEAKRLLSFVPLTTGRLCLQEEMFLNLTADSDQQWQPVAEYWQQQVTELRQALTDCPHEEWLTQLRGRSEVMYQSRFRDMGVDYFYAQQGQLTERYTALLLTIITQELQQTMQRHPYPPETMKHIVRAIINLLQQRVIEVQQLATNLQQQVIAEGEQQLHNLEEQWASIGLIGRLRGKDQGVIATYQQQLATWLQARTQLAGCAFAIKLLDELIPQLSAVGEPADKLDRITAEAVSILTTRHNEIDPTRSCGFFAPQQIQVAADAIDADNANLRQTYLRLTSFFYDKETLLDGEDLVMRCREALQDDINAYINERISMGSLPPVCGVPIRKRINSMYADQGGTEAFDTRFRQQADLHIPLRSPETHEQRHQYQVIELPDELHILHALHGLTLQDFDGFSGQHMFIEPSLF